MKKFLVLYMADAAAFQAAMANSSPEQQKKGMDAWKAWMSAHHASMVDGGAPAGKTKRVDAKGVSDTRNGIGGYSIVQAETHDEAASMFGQDHPHIKLMPGAWIEVIEIMPMPAM